MIHTVRFQKVVAQKSEIKIKIKTYDFQENFLQSYHMKKKNIDAWLFQKEKV